MIRVCIVTIVLLLCSPLFAEHKYALLIGISKYDHAEMNKPEPLKFPEDDASAVGKALKEGGYEVETLLGKHATLEAIEKTLSQLARRGSAEGIVLIGLFGHGVEIETRGDDKRVVTEGCFCPFDTGVRVAKDEQGRVFRDGSGQTMLEPDPTSLLRLSNVMITLKESKAGNRVVLADCCRTVPNQARGRSFGAGFRAQDLPENTSILFGCSPNQRAFEHQAWGHGAFTKCLLDAMVELSATGKVRTAGLADKLIDRVPELVRTVAPRDRQTPVLFSTNSVDLRLTSLSSTNTGVPLSLINKSALPSPPSKSIAPTDRPQQRASAGQNLEGIQSGELKELVPGIAFRWCRAGTFKMGEGSESASTSLNSGFWLGETEVTQEKWKKLMGTTPWDKAGVKKGNDYAASYMSHSQATDFCKKLTTQEQTAGRLPHYWSYTLPTEAQWEYACRAGTTTSFSFGDNTSQLRDYGWFVDNAGDNKERYPHRVGQKKSNAWGFRDMHGNVEEWCSSQKIRGGSWDSSATNCKSSYRGNAVVSAWETIGFRIAAVQADYEGRKAGDAKELLPGFMFRWCPQGQFVAIVKGFNEDRPSEVTVPQGFWMGESEVTQSQWHGVMDRMPWRDRDNVKEGDDYPASCVSYNDAVLYCEMLTAAENTSGRLPKDWKFSLPTAAQWEYACRAGRTTKYSFGDDMSVVNEYGWFSENCETAGERFPHQIHRKKPNAWGLYDMHGNVEEWCSGWPVEWKVDADSSGLHTEKLISKRGGSWDKSAIDSCSGQGIVLTPGILTNGTGLRITATRVSE